MTGPPKKNDTFFFGKSSAQWAKYQNGNHQKKSGNRFFPVKSMRLGKWMRKNSREFPLNPLAQKKCELSPKFNCCKMEYLFILRFKGPLRFSMFRTCLSRKLVWPCVFLNGLRDFGCRAPFWRPCTFACVPGRFFQSVFVAPLQHGHSSRWERLQWTVRFWFYHLRVIAFSSRAKHMLQVLEVLQAVL